MNEKIFLEIESQEHSISIGYTNYNSSILKSNNKKKFFLIHGKTIKAKSTHRLKDHCV